MGRRRTVNHDLPPKMQRKGRAYYYVCNSPSRQWVPLGSDLTKAKRKWAELDAGAPQSLSVGDLVQRYISQGKLSPLPARAAAHSKSLRCIRCIGSNGGDSDGGVREGLANRGRGQLSDAEEVMRCPTCGQRVARWRISAWWMNDNHTFVRLTGSPDEMVEQAKKACLEHGGGMLPPPRWVDDVTRNEKTMTGVPYVHDKHGYLNDRELDAWARAVEVAIAEPERKELEKSGAA